MDIPEGPHDRSKLPAASGLLSGKTLRVYEDCPRCTGSGTQAFGGPCLHCGGDGSVRVPMDLDELRAIIKTIADASVKEALTDMAHGGDTDWPKGSPDRS